MEIGLIIKEIKNIAKGTTEVVFNRPKDFNFLAGQYTQFSLAELKYPDSNGKSRVFTIASSPNNKEILSIAFRDTGSGYKKTLSELQKGSEVFIEEASGFFTLPKQGKHIFIAGGIGIVPFLSMVRAFESEEEFLNTTLFYVNRNKESAPYLEELENLSEKSKNFSLYSIFERTSLKHFQEYLNDSNLNWWIVGPPRMVADVKYLLISAGVLESKIRTEDFIGY